MTLEEIAGFSRAISRKELEQRALLIADLAVSAQGDGKSIKRAIERIVKEMKNL